MRQHKYRAYNTKLKKMAQAIAIELDPESGGVYVWGKDHVDWLTGEHEADRDFWQWDDCVELEWSGEFDKNEKEIYESDIVRVNGGQGVLDFVSEIIFDHAAFRIRDAYDQGFPHQSDIEIIGNIHERPELLKEQPK